MLPSLLQSSTLCFKGITPPEQHKHACEKALSMIRSAFREILVKNIPSVGDSVYLANTTTNTKQI